MDITHAAAVAVTVGQTGAWIGPLVAALAAGALDYSAAGPHAIRDRVAVVGYYAAAISFVYLFGLHSWERSVITGYNWRMAGAVASLATHCALLLAMFGSRLAWTKGLATALAARLKIDSDASKTTKINTTLVGWTVGAAVAAPLSGSAGWGHVVDGIGMLTTGAASAVAGAILSWLGG